MALRTCFYLLTYLVNQLTDEKLKVQLKKQLRHNVPVSLWH